MSASLSGWARFSLELFKTLLFRSLHFWMSQIQWVGSSITRKIIFSSSFFGTLHRPRGLDFVNFDTISVLSRELLTPHVPLLSIISASFRDVKMTQHATRGYDPSRQCNFHQAEIWQPSLYLLTDICLELCGPMECLIEGVTWPGSANHKPAPSLQLSKEARLAFIQSQTSNEMIIRKVYLLKGTTSTTCNTCFLCL